MDARWDHGAPPHCATTTAVRTRMMGDRRALRCGGCVRATRGAGRARVRARLGDFGAMIMVTMVMTMRARGARGQGTISMRAGAVDEDSMRAHASPWVRFDVDGAVATTPPSYETLAYAYDADAGRARFRGWFQLTTVVEAGKNVLSTPLPKEIRPAKDEMWKVTLKGAERELTVTTDGGLVLAGEYQANTWFVLRGLEYYTAAAFEPVEDAGDETCDASSGSCGA